MVIIKEILTTLNTNKSCWWSPLQPWVSRMAFQARYLWNNSSWMSGNVFQWEGKEGITGEGNIISVSILVTWHSRDSKVLVMSGAYGAEIVWNGRGDESNAGQDLVCHMKNFMLYLKALVLKNGSEGTNDQSRMNGLFGHKEVRQGVIAESLWWSPWVKQRQWL